MDAEPPDRHAMDSTGLDAGLLRGPAESARVLLQATNEFLACDDIDSVARAIATAIDGVFRPDKVGVTIAEPEGSLRLAYSLGYSEEELAAIDVALASGGGLIRRVVGGEGMWSDDVGREDLRARLATFGAVDGFTIPIAGPTGVVGTCSALYLQPRSFDEAFRSAAVGLAAQAGLALSLIASRDDVRRAAAEAARRHRTSQTLLTVAADLAPATDPSAIPDLLVSAIRAASGAGSAMVARHLRDGSGFRVLRTSGLSDEQGTMLDGRLLPVTSGGALDRLLSGSPTISRPNSSALHAASGLGVSVNAPIISGDEVWGFLGLADPEDAADETELLELVTGFAAIAATAIARADAVSEGERQRRRSDTLLELSSVLATVEDRDEIAAVVCTFIKRASGTPFALVGRRLPDDEAFAVAASSGLSTDQVRRIQTALGRIDRASLRDLLSGSVTARSGEQAVGPGMGIGMAIAAPIVIDGRTEGFIAIGAPPELEIAGDDSASLLVAFAALSATAMARADAVADVSRQRDVLATEVAERTRSLRTALDELHVASEAKTDFLANVSHELRTPLTAIVGFAEVLATGIDGTLSDAQQRDMDTILDSSRHLLALIDDLIDIAAIEAGRVHLAIEVVDPVALVRDSVASLLPLATARGIAVAVEADEEERTGIVRVAADPDRLREIVLNLISNAVKFAPPGGRVRVAFAPAPAVEDGGRDDDGPSHLAISFHDDGPGIAAKDHDRIFDKFTRIADPAVPGTGLGLAIARELARMHGGDVTVASRLGHGSTFTIRIPVASSQ